MHNILQNMDIHDYKKIIIVGSAGSGKSWLAKKLAEITGYPLTHLDNEFWRPGWVETPKDEWTEKQFKLISGDRWIIDGNYGGTMELRFAAADLIILLDISRFVCACSAIRRHGKKRSDLPGYLSEKFDSEFADFLKWIWSYPKNGKLRVLSLHKKYPEKAFLILKSRGAVGRFLTEQKGKKHA